MINRPCESNINTVFEEHFSSESTKKFWYYCCQEPQRQNAVFSRQKDTSKRKMGLLLSAYSLSAITEANKQKNKQYSLLIRYNLQV